MWIEFHFCYFGFIFYLFIGDDKVYGFGSNEYGQLGLTFINCVYPKLLNWEFKNFIITGNTSNHVFLN